MAELCKQRNALAHDWYFAQAIVDLLDADGMEGASVDDTLVVLDGNQLALVIKDGRIVLDEAIHLIVNSAIEVRKVKLSPKPCAMSGLAIGQCKARVDVIEGGDRMLVLAKDGAATGLVQKHIKVMGLIRKATIVVEDILALGTTNASSNSNGFGSREGAEYGQLESIRRGRQPA